jgi:HTH-type transcriptional regulator / antitoxin HigA
MMSNEGSQNLTSQELRFDPDYATPTGVSIRSTLATLGMTQADLAARIGLSIKHVNQVLQGIAPVTPGTALSLEKVTGVPAHIWNALEATYRDTLARAEDRASSAADADWLTKLPLKELIKRGAIKQQTDRARLVQEICRFFGVANRESWEAVWSRPLAAFRQSRTLEGNAGAIASWLRLGELAAKEIECAPYVAHRFRDLLKEIRGLTRLATDDFVAKLIDLCAQSGVAVVFVPAIPKSRCWGAAKWLTPTKALIELSLRYKSDDHLWFSFFHESAHLLLHSKKATFVTKGGFSDDAERDADDFAATFLIPREYEPELRRLTEAEIPPFAERVGIAPGIVVGRLQHEALLPRNKGNNLKRWFRFVDQDGGANE